MLFLQHTVIYKCHRTFATTPKHIHSTVKQLNNGHRTKPTTQTTNQTLHLSSSPPLPHLNLPKNLSIRPRSHHISPPHPRQRSLRIPQTPSHPPRHTNRLGHLRQRHPQTKFRIKNRLLFRKKCCSLLPHRNSSSTRYIESPL